MNSIVLKPTLDSNSAIPVGIDSLHAQDSHTAEPTHTKNPELTESIRTGLREIAIENALSIGQLAQGVVEQALQMGTRLWRMNIDLKRKEYKAFLGVLGWGTTKARKYINLAKTFDGFELSKLTRIELTTLFSLTSNRYKEVVATVREMADISQELVEQLMKQSRSPKKPQEDPISGWKQSRSGGSRYYNVLLHDEHTGLLIEEQAQAEGILPQQVIASAVAQRAQQETAQCQPDAYTVAQMQEFQDEVTKMRTLVHENQKLEIKLQEREQRIAELETQIAQLIEPVDEVTLTSSELDHYLEQQVQEIAPEETHKCDSHSQQELEQEAVPLEPAQSESILVKVAQVSDRNIQVRLAAKVQRPSLAQGQSQVFQVGEEVKIVSDRHGQDLVRQVGTVIAASRVGATVEIAGQIRWFCTDEIVPLSKQIK